MRNYKYGKQLILITFAIFFAEGVQAQSIKVNSATSQGWAGGICCRYGTKYNIELEIVQKKTPITLDTLWLEGYAIPLSTYNQKKKHPTDTFHIQIMEELVFDDNSIHLYNPSYLNGGYHDESKTGITVSYFIGNKKKMLDVKPLLQELEFLAYP